MLGVTSVYEQFPEHQSSSVCDDRRESFALRGFDSEHSTRPSRKIASSKCVTSSSVSHSVPIEHGPHDQGRDAQDAERDRRARARELDQGPNPAPLGRCVSSQRPGCECCLQEAEDAATHEDHPTQCGIAEEGRARQAATEGVHDGSEPPPNREAATGEGHGLHLRAHGLLVGRSGELRTPRGDDLRRAAEQLPSVLRLGREDQPRGEGMLHPSASSGNVAGTGEDGADQGHPGRFGRRPRGATTGGPAIVQGGDRLAQAEDESEEVRLQAQGRTIHVERGQRGVDQDGGSPGPCAVRCDTARGSGEPEGGAASEEGEPQRVFLGELPKRAGPVSVASCEDTAEGSIGCPGRSQENRRQLSGGRARQLEEAAWSLVPRAFQALVSEGRPVLMEIGCEPHSLLAEAVCREVGWRFYYTCRCLC